MVGSPYMRLLNIAAEQHIPYMRLQVVDVIIFGHSCVLSRASVSMFVVGMARCHTVTEAARKKDFD
jgi:hypothetical protein